MPSSADASSGRARRPHSSRSTMVSRIRSPSDGASLSELTGFATTPASMCRSTSASPKMTSRTSSSSPVGRSRVGAIATASLAQRSRTDAPPGHLPSFRSKRVCSDEASVTARRRLRRTMAVSLAWSASCSSPSLVSRRRWSSASTSMSNSPCSAKPSIVCSSSSANSSSTASISSSVSACVRCAAVHAKLVVTTDLVTSPTYAKRATAMSAPGPRPAPPWHSLSASKTRASPRSSQMGSWSKTRNCRRFSAIMTERTFFLFASLCHGWSCASGRVAMRLSPTVLPSFSFMPTCMSSRST
mmetsp:Transcript_34929/g.115781  ORF Transcript_34929/g.115781 Transcript_34929/m.115781 type:complete len:300 (-) Transcript_34929:1321-2220(-)